MEFKDMTFILTEEEVLKMLATTSALGSLVAKYGERKLFNEIKEVSQRNATNMKAGKFKVLIKEEEN